MAMSNNEKIEHYASIGYLITVAIYRKDKWFCSIEFESDSALNVSFSTGSYKRRQYAIDSAFSMIAEHNPHMSI